MAKRHPHVSFDPIEAARRLLATSPHIIICWRSDFYTWTSAPPEWSVANAAVESRLMLWMEGAGISGTRANVAEVVAALKRLCYVHDFVAIRDVPAPEKIEAWRRERLRQMAPKYSDAFEAPVRLNTHDLSAILSNIDPSDHDAFDLFEIMRAVHHITGGARETRDYFFDEWLRADASLEASLRGKWNSLASLAERRGDESTCDMPTLLHYLREDGKAKVAQEVADIVRAMKRMPSEAAE